MATLKKLPTLAVTNPVLLRLFELGFEEIIDPNNPYHQISLNLAIHEMAKLISDRAVRDEIQNAMNKSIVNIAQKNAK